MTMSALADSFSIRSRLAIGSVGTSRSRSPCQYILVQVTHNDSNPGQQGFDFVCALQGAHDSGVFEFRVAVNQSVQHGSANVAG